MEVLVRLLVWVLDLLYGPWGGWTVKAVTQDPMDEIVRQQYEDERKAKRTDQIVAAFKSTTAPVPGAVDYDELKWDSYEKAVETPEHFLLYNGQSVQKIIAKSAFSNRQELVTLRRVIRRHVSDCELRDD